MASSRVGLRIRTFIVLVRGTAARASITGIENARVLPVPVCAVATTSRPSMSGGMACAWTGVGVTNSFLSRLFRNAEQRLSSEKCCIDCVGFFLRRTGTLSVFRIAALGEFTRLETRCSQGMQDRVRFAELPGSAFEEATDCRQYRIRQCDTSGLFRCGEALGHPNGGSHCAGVMQQLLGARTEKDEQAW